ncbi:MAG TPA: sigma-54 dependent transcriptional regulator [Candidatus Acidoferrales bacterium]|nr:sigma-54 dependent transcriptional regulator [Candidatus Acidoferrales bacterium]
MSEPARTILVVDDEPGQRAMLRAVLTAEGYQVAEAEDGSSAVARVEAHFYDLILMDVRMAQLDGMAALQTIKGCSPGIPIILMTAYGTVRDAVEAMKAGAYDYLTKPLDIDELKLTVARGLRHAALEEENARLRALVGHDVDVSAIIGSSAPMRLVFEAIALVAPTEATVLILGESGTGKELVAQAIHANSPRRAAPFITVNCAALPETLLESELFGHERGAFTGATERRLGRFELAHGGTIFLDEIGELTPAAQTKLLRVLQSQEFERVGGSKTLKIDVRVLAATNKDLDAAVRAGQFREDLLYRLRVFPLTVPPLRQRRDDIPLLAEHFLKRYAERHRRRLRGLTPRALDRLMRSDWPGNVRELEHTIERAVILARGEYLTPEELPPNLQALAGEAEHTVSQGPAMGVGLTLKEVERELIRKTLKHLGGNRTKAAEILGISRATLHNKLKEHGLN